MKTTLFARIIILLLLIWAVLFFGSFFTLAIVQPEGDGFTRGLNRLGVFLGAQFAALLVGLWVRRLTFSRVHLVSARLYFLSRVPVLLMVGEIALLAGTILVLWATT